MYYIEVDKDNILIDMKTRKTIYFDTVEQAQEIARILSRHYYKHEDIKIKEAVK